MSHYAVDLVTMIRPRKTLFFQVFLILCQLFFLAKMRDTLFLICNVQIKLKEILVFAEIMLKEILVFVASPELKLICVTVTATTLIAFFIFTVVYLVPIHNPFRPRYLLSCSISLLESSFLPHATLTYS